MPCPKQKQRVVMLHGVEFTKKSRSNLCRFAPAFNRAGFEVVLPTYGYIPALLVGIFDWIDRRIADSMSAFIQDGDIVLGHSNGATLAYLISKHHHIKGAILINPALEPDMVPDAEFTHVYFNAGDIVSRLSAMLPFNPWGSMGQVGYIGSDKRVTNFDCENTPNLPFLNGHSDIFMPGKTRPWSAFIAQACLTALES